MTGSEQFFIDKPHIIGYTSVRMPGCYLGTLKGVWYCLCKRIRMEGCEMKRSAVVVVVVCLLALAQAGWAANLDSSWYVKLSQVALFGYDPNTGHDFGLDWVFTGALGDEGPFRVSSPDPVWAQRMVSVPTSVAATPGTSVYLWGAPEASVPATVSELTLFWETNYVSSQMRLDLLSYDGSAFTLLWSQAKSGTNSDFSNVLGSFQSIPLGSAPVFRVTVVPEPPAGLAFASLVGLAFARRRLAGW